jgi:3-deoxy-D-manno-oct-2-ulosonic acid (Kdo) hydroxylase
VPDVRTLGVSGWTAVPAGSVSDAAAFAESGDVLFLPSLPFAIEPSEHQLFSPAIVRSAKNVSFNPQTGTLSSVALDRLDAMRLRSLMSRFSRAASAFVEALLAPYRGRIDVGRASFRPVEIAGRSSSWRKDDTRLHVDSFPATPVHGRRILRLFTNVNPDRRPRIWRIGEDFEPLVRRFASQLRLPWRSSAYVLRLLRLTKSERTPYDSLMLQLHDRMKADEDYQVHSPQTQFEFPSGTTWIAFTDRVSHAAMAGQYQLEQTFLLPVEAMIDPRLSPLRILERTLARPLV